MAKANLKMPMAIPSLQIDGEGEDEDANGDPSGPIDDKVKLKIPMVIPLLQIGGKCEVKYANSDGEAPWQKLKLAKVS